MTKRPSTAWAASVFSSPPRIDVETHGKQTTRHPVWIAWRRTVGYANGGYERVAHHLLEHLWAEGLVKRWKSQPINLNELGGPNAVPDILVELASGSLHVVQVKAQRFMTKDVEEKFERERQFLEPLGFVYRVWTTKDVLSSKTSHTVAELDRGRLHPAPAETIARIHEASKAAHRLGELLDQFGWDDTLSAAAHLAFHIDITEPLHENTPLLRNHSCSRYTHLFARRDATASWWEELAPAQL
jgi:hypothetical protein